MRKKILFISNVDWFFVSHRLPIALLAQKNGYEVHLAAVKTESNDLLKSKGIKFHDLGLSRSGNNLFSELITLFQIFF